MKPKSTKQRGISFALFTSIFNARLVHFHGRNSTPIFMFPLLNKHPGTNLAETCQPETCYLWGDFYEPTKSSGELTNWIKSHFFRLLCAPPQPMPSQLDTTQVKNSCARGTPLVRGTEWDPICGRFLCLGGANTPIYAHFEAIFARKMEISPQKQTLNVKIPPCLTFFLCTSMGWSHLAKKFMADRTPSDQA